MTVVQANLRGTFVKSALAHATNRYAVGTAIASAESRGQADVAAVLRGITKSAVGVVDGDSLMRVRASQDFTAAVVAAEIVGRLRERRTALFEEYFPAVTTPPQFYWANRKGGAVPLARLSLATDKLDPLHLGAIVALSDATLRLSNVEAVAEAEMKMACVAASDSAFIDPANAGETDVKPASVLHGLTPIGATSDPRADLKRLVSDFPGDIMTSYLVMHPNTATEMGLFAAGGTFAFADVGPRGGVAAGVPVLTSKSVPLDSSGGIVALIDAAAVIVADDGVQLDTSTQTDLAMLDNPSGTAQMVSLWQNSAVAIRLIRAINFRMADSIRARYLSGVSW